MSAPPPPSNEIAPVEQPGLEDDSSNNHQSSSSFPPPRNAGPYARKSPSSSASSASSGNRSLPSSVAESGTTTSTLVADADAAAVELQLPANQDRNHRRRPCRPFDRTDVVYCVSAAAIPVTVLALLVIVVYAFLSYHAPLSAQFDKYAGKEHDLGKDSPIAKQDALTVALIVTVVNCLLAVIVGLAQHYLQRDRWYPLFCITFFTITFVLNCFFCLSASGAASERIRSADGFLKTLAGVDILADELVKFWKDVKIARGLNLEVAKLLGASLLPLSLLFSGVLMQYLVIDGWMERERRAADAGRAVFRAAMENEAPADGQANFVEEDETKGEKKL